MVLKMEILRPAPFLKPLKPKKPSPQITIFLSGASAARKGTDILYQAFENIENKLNNRYNLFLIMAANYKKEEPWYPINQTCLERNRQIYEKCRQKKNVYFNGIYPTALVEYVYNRSDIYVLPARFDTCPFSTFEAMVSGLPMIATDIHCFPEAIKPGENGFLIKTAGYEDLQSDDFFYYAVETLEGYLLQLIEDSDLRQKMGQTSRQRIEKKFNLAISDFNKF